MPAHDTGGEHNARSWASLGLLVAVPYLDENPPRQDAMGKNRLPTGLGSEAGFAIGPVD